MREGRPFDVLDPDLVALRSRAKKLLRRLEQTGEDDIQQRAALLHELLGGHGATPLVEAGFRCEFGRNITVGDYFYANFDCVILDSAPVTIGNHVLLGPQVGLYTVSHSLDPQQRAGGLCTAAPIALGDHVWLGGGVRVCPGVTVGENTVVGAGSVVTKDLPANSLAAGNPCRVLRPLSPQDRLHAPK
ncbi:MAG TPA: sugar O-acetyltransferase [Candidatus Gallacutalibacter stercoravium]|nr:sugar O-acetyltransferase [Candidatus Gallacutalibacter stercoravium]